MTLGASFTIESGHRDDLDRHALALRFEFNGVQNIRRILLIGHKDLLNGPSTGLQQFEHGVATLNLFAAESFPVTTRGATSSRVPSNAGGTPPGPRCSALGPGCIPTCGTGTHAMASTRTTAVAPIPSTRPNAPRPSVVVALTETVVPTNEESSRDIEGMYGANFGRSAMIVTSADATSKPASRTRRIVSSSSRREGTPLKPGSSSGKCRPRSPRLAAPSKASQRA